MPKSADLNPTQMKTAIPKLERRIIELKELDINTIQKPYESRVEALTNKVNDTLRGIFGANTIEYGQYRVNLGMYIPCTNRQKPLREVKEAVRDHVESAISNLTTIIDLFKENLDDLGETQSGKALNAFGDLALHPEIERASADLFKNEHYSNAIENACKALNLLVKLRSGRDDLDGTDLMLKVFSPDKPILKFNEMKTDSDKSEQRGMMFLFAGVMSALRNPRAHGLIDDNPENALEQISFISFLAKSLNKTEK